MLYLFSQEKHKHKSVFMMHLLLSNDTLPPEKFITVVQKELVLFSSTISFQLPSSLDDESSPFSYTNDVSPLPSKLDCRSLADSLSAVTEEAMNRVRQLPPGCRWWGCSGSGDRSSGAAAVAWYHCSSVFLPCANCWRILPGQYVTVYKLALTSTKKVVL